MVAAWALKKKNRAAEFPTEMVAKHPGIIPPYVATPVAGAADDRMGSKPDQAAGIAAVGFAK